MRLHHVQVSCPAGGEAVARAFYSGVLGIPEVAKPPALAARGGCWFRADGVEIHVGVEEGFVAAAKAHPALYVDDLDAVARSCTAAGHPVGWDDDFTPYLRFHTVDGHGNRVEILGSRADPAHPVPGQRAEPRADPAQDVPGQPQTARICAATDAAWA